jgi:hypothetical protein
MRPSSSRSAALIPERQPISEPSRHRKQPNHDVFDGVLKTTRVSRGEVSRLLKTIIRDDGMVHSKINIRALLERRLNSRLNPFVLLFNSCGPASYHSADSAFYISQTPAFDVIPSKHPKAMKSFWPRPASNGDRSGQSPPPGRESEENPPGEHTRLLPNRLDGGPYLSPDDPAVSPYNLWTVRFVRWVTVALTCITFAWWVLMVVSVFITPPGLHVRGSPFFAFSYASIALLTLIVSLLFFSVPSRLARILSIVIAVVLLVDAIIILAVPGLRHGEVWVGIASVVWASLMAIWFVTADWTVQWGKAEEEQRLTGRPESRRSVFEWVEVMLSTIALTVIAIVVVLMTLTLTLRAIDLGLAPPGERYWVDGGRYQIHLYCYGNKTDAAGAKTTTVLLEGGEDPVERGLWQFAENAVNNGSISRFCFADRPGMAWVSC